MDLTTQWVVGNCRGKPSLWVQGTAQIFSGLSKSIHPWFSTMAVADSSNHGDIIVCRRCHGCLGDSRISDQDCDTVPIKVYEREIRKKGVSLGTELQLCWQRNYQSWLVVIGRNREDMKKGKRGVEGGLQKGILGERNHWKIGSCIQMGSTWRAQLLQKSNCRDVHLFLSDFSIH